jgi:hypothetical protein
MAKSQSVNELRTTNGPQRVGGDLVIFFTNSSNWTVATLLCQPVATAFSRTKSATRPYGLRHYNESRRPQKYSPVPGARRYAATGVTGMMNASSLAFRRKLA